MWDALHSSMLHWYRLVGSGSDGARAIERDGVVAALVPASAQRSVVNAVVYEHPDALATAYDAIAAAYDAIGAKWTVWVHDGDRETAELLERAGHVLDAAPEAMAVDLVAAPPRRPARDALADWTAEGELSDVGAINDRAYGYGGDWFSRALTQLPDGAVQIYVARQEGQAVGCCAIVDNGTNTEVQMVAVLPEARGNGISGTLLAHGLADAMERGARTGTLVATKLGRPVYEKLGFRSLGVLEMWERRLDQR
ncbi:MAG: GNAT family N-acetyltransferase [Thermoleophilaceae bacterium]|nr:GNAT family N-acetyltransferase [Thermoleophilaceae bacterium]